MNRLLLILVTSAVLVGVAAAASALPSRSHVSQSRRIDEPALWGHIKSLTRHGGRYELRFDPALWLTGLAADRAAKQDGREVTNDYYVVEESHRLITYA